MSSQRLIPELPCRFFHLLQTVHNSVLPQRSFQTSHPHTITVSPQWTLPNTCYTLFNHFSRVTPHDSEVLQGEGGYLSLTPSYPQYLPGCLAHIRHPITFVTPLYEKHSQARGSDPLGLSHVQVSQIKDIPPMISFLSLVPILSFPPPFNQISY